MYIYERHTQKNKRNNTIKACVKPIQNLLFIHGVVSFPVVCVCVYVCMRCVCYILLFIFPQACNNIFNVPLLLIEWSCAASKNTYNIIKLNGIVERERRRTAKLTNLEQHLNNASSFVVFFFVHHYWWVWWWWWWWCFIITQRIWVTKQNTLLLKLSLFFVSFLYI